MATLITVTLTSGQSLGIATADLVFATNDGTDTILTVENSQTNPVQIRVTESLNDIIALDDSFLSVTTTDGKVWVLSGSRIKTIEDFTTFRQIGYEGVGINNIQYKVTDALAAIIAAVNSAGGGSASRLIASLENVDLQTIAANVLAWESGKSAANTVATNIILKLESGAFAASVEILNEGVNGDTITNSDFGVTITQDGLKSKSDLALEYVTAMNAAIVPGFLVANNEFIEFGNTYTEITQSHINISSTGDISLSAQSLYNVSILLNSVSQFASTAMIAYNDGKQMISLPTNYTLENTGNWALPVTVGTQDPFVVSIYIYGDTI